MNWKAKLTHYLSEQGLRMTWQRSAIADIFFGHEGHPSIEELYNEVRAKHANIGQATVYRTLKLLVESGLAESSHFGDGSARYEATHDREHHDHLVCVGCGHIIEFRNDEIERLQELIAKEHGFELVDHEMILYGKCVRENCLGRQVD